MKKSLFLQEDSFITLQNKWRKVQKVPVLHNDQGTGFDAFKGSTRSWLSDSCCHLNFADPIDHHDRAHVVKN